MSESKLRSALVEEAARVIAEPAPWAVVEERAQELIARRRRVRTAISGSLAAAAALVVVLLATGVSRNDGRELRVVDPGPSVAASPSSTEGDGTPADEGEPDVVYPAGLEAIWPITSQEDLDLHLSTGSTEYDDPGRTGEVFLRKYVGMERAVTGQVVEGAPGPGGRTATIPVASFQGGAERMSIFVAEVSSGGPWTVTLMISEDIKVTEPLPAATARSPLRLRGEAAAFEGTVTVEVRQDGQLRGDRLGTSFVTGRGDGVPGPFQGNIAFSTPSRPGGAVVFFEESAEDGMPFQATVVRVRFGS